MAVMFWRNADGSYDPEDIGLANEGAIEGADYIQQFYDAGVFPSGLVGEQGINVLDSLFTGRKSCRCHLGTMELVIHI